MNRRTLPLGIDIGSSRVRVVEAERTLQGARIRAVAVREFPEACAGGPQDSQYLGALIEDAVLELRTRERRCVCAIGEPDALLRTLKMPQMTFLERERAARFEAQRFVEYPQDDAVVRIHRLGDREDVWALGIGRRSAIVTRGAALKAAGLQIVAMDHESCALVRALPGFDAVLDVGYHRTSLHVPTDEVPLTLHVYSGGADLTRAIERELAIDGHTAEKRKRILGTAGGGERARAALVCDIATLIHSARSMHVVGRVALVGNGSRLPGLATDLESHAGVSCEIPVSHALRGANYPDDVVRSSAPDWTLGAGLALWGRN